MKIYLIRHGETDWNKLRRLQGQADIPLNEFGRQLARETEPALRNVPFDRIYTSPLKRARETAELVTAGRNLPIIEEPRLKEMGFGEFEGLCCREEGWNIPDPGFRDFFNAPEKYRPPKGGESFQQVSDRLESFLKELYATEELQDKTVLLSTHGAALCGILRLIKKNPMERYWDGGVHKNCAVTIVEVKDGKATILQEAVTYYNEAVEDW
ncbi:MAG TPA: histidine phosphatase family protein [Candidatus Bariatricus faecipullorum]|nr:histidine phosphatase family protein [Candidatus Bariatricus faecipullorum]